jgi:uncharacterized membrane protein YesL
MNIFCGHHLYLQGILLNSFALISVISIELRVTIRIYRISLSNSFLIAVCRFSALLRIIGSRSHSLIMSSHFPSLIIIFGSATIRLVVMFLLIENVHVRLFD